MRELLAQLVAPVSREQRALLVSGAPRQARPELLVGLAREVAFVAAVDSGGDDVRRANLTPELLLGDFDSIEGASLKAAQSAGVEVIGFDAHKDATDLELALQLLRARGFEAIVATKVLGGRLDHELAALACLAAAAQGGVRVAIIEEQSACVILCGDGNRSVLHLDFRATPSPSHISLIPWGSDATVSTNGLKWELDHECLAFTASRGISNLPIRGKAEIKTHQGSLLVILSYDEGANMGSGDGAGAVVAGRVVG
jgi:thiamine pyrophosphokinase